MRKKYLILTIIIILFFLGNFNKLPAQFITLSTDSLYFLTVEDAMDGRDLLISKGQEDVIIYDFTFNDPAIGYWWYEVNKDLPCTLSLIDTLVVKIGSDIPTENYDICKDSIFISTNYDTLVFITLYIESGIMGLVINPSQTDFKIMYGGELDYNNYYYNACGQKILAVDNFLLTNKPLKFGNGFYYKYKRKLLYINKRQ